jgi:hypothetical protein
MINGKPIYPKIEVRSLIYHICPLRSNDLWMRNLDQLKARIEIFNGRKIFAIAKGDEERLHDPEEVIEYLQPSGHYQILKVNNCTNLRETESFQPLLRAIESTSHNHAIFYAHTKGNSTYDDVLGATYWRNAMYHVLLDGWENCMKELESYPAVGTTKICWGQNKRSPYPSRLCHGQWMFAGTFFWFRAREVFENEKWPIVPRDRYGAESWISGLFDMSQGKSIMQPWPEEIYPAPSPYDPRQYQKIGLAIPDEELYQPNYCI